MIELENKIGYIFDKKNTSYCKGIAIILMIVHHLFWNVPNIGLKIGQVAISQRIAIIGKVCVSIFLLLSGIGLYRSDNKKLSLKKFYKKRLLKLYLNYCFIVASSFLILIIFFREYYIESIGIGIKSIIKIILNFTGLQFIIGYQGINGAWWFMSVIFLCYITFPFIVNYLNKYEIKFIVFSFCISFINIIPLGKIKILDIISWMLPFIVGCYIAKINFFEKLKYNIYLNDKKLKKMGLLFLLILLAIIRAFIPSQNKIGIKFDLILAVTIIGFIYVFWENTNITKKIICYLGEKSMDIYYIHMFISNYLLDDLIYSVNSPVLMIIIVILLSLLWSYCLDRLRILSKFSDLLKKI